MSAHGCAHEVLMTIASCIGMVLRIMVLMADFTHILATRPDFTESDREWLHHLVADWQVIADLSFADLLLIVQDGDGNYRIVEQCRPSTVMTLRIDDAVGALVAPEMVGEHLRPGGQQRRGKVHPAAGALRRVRPGRRQGAHRRPGAL